MTRTVIESQTKTVTIGFDEPFCVIGERINPTGRKKLAAQLEASDFSTVEKDALEQVACGAMVLDITLVWYIIQTQIQMKPSHHSWSKCCNWFRG